MIIIKHRQSLTL